MQLVVVECRLTLCILLPSIHSGREPLVLSHDSFLGSQAQQRHSIYRRRDKSALWSLRSCFPYKVEADDPEGKAGMWGSD